MWVLPTVTASVMIAQLQWPAQGQMSHDPVDFRPDGAFRPARFSPRALFGFRNKIRNPDSPKEFSSINIPVPGPNESTAAEDDTYVPGLSQRSRHNFDSAGWVRGLESARNRANPTGLETSSRCGGA